MLQAPDGGAKLEVSTPEAPFADEPACLADAEQVMKRGDGMERVRRHPTTFAGARALALEGDPAPGTSGHGPPATAAPRTVFFTARTPPSPEALDAYRTVVSSARIGGNV